MAMVVAVALPAEASAQGLFESLFGAFGVRPRYPQAYADPRGDFPNTNPQTAPQAPAGQGGIAYCVRLCDGRFFPMQRHANATPVQICSALCPASRTQVFSGGAIDRAVARDGSRYADLDNAFVYRSRMVANCTCNGRDSFGLAPMDVATDPTLREGDIVATPTGFVAYSARTKRGNETANFTPIDNSRLSRDLREKLANITVAPAN